MPADPWEQAAQQFKSSGPSKSSTEEPKNEDWKLWQQGQSNATTTPPTTAMGRFGAGLYDSTLGAFKGISTDPIGTTGRIIGGIANSVVPTPSPDLMQSAYQHLTTPGERGKLGGDYAQSLMQHPAVAPAVPVAQDIQQGNLAGAAGRVTGLGAMAAAPKVLGSAGKALGVPEAATTAQRVITSPDVWEKAGNVIPFMNMGTKLRGLGEAVSQAKNSTGVPPPPPATPPNAPPLPRRLSLPAPSKPAPAVASPPRVLPVRIPMPPPFRPPAGPATPPAAPSAAAPPTAPTAPTVAPTAPPTAPTQTPTIGKPSSVKPIDVQLRDALAEGSGDNAKINNEGILEYGIREHPDASKIRTDDANFKGFMDSQANPAPTPAPPPTPPAPSVKIRTRRTK